VAKINRKELKHDRFAEEVQHSLEFVGEHQNQFKLYAGIGVAVLAVIVGVYMYINSQHAQREAALKEALKVQGSAVGTNQSEFVLTFPTAEARNKAIIEKFTEVANKYPGTDEGVTAQYYLGITYADLGKLDEAEKAFRVVENKGNKTYAPLGRFALAQIYESRGKYPEAEKELRAIIDSPSVLLSKEQATIALARVVARTKPDEARKLLEPYRASARSAVSRAAIDNLSNMPQKK
jgi:tetratricopeptide (TPR) repeat protein